MFKRITAILLSVSLILIFAGCKKQQTIATDVDGYDNANNKWSEVAAADMPKFQNGTLTEKEFLDLISPYTDWRIYEIRTTATTVKPKGSGTAYYVSNDGDNANDGLSPSTPLADYVGVTKKGLKSGDVIYFERGGVWRSQINLMVDGVTLSAYGEGKKPEFYMSVKNGANPDFWQKTDAENVWVFDTRISEDVGTIIFDDEQWAFKSLYKKTDIGNSTTGRYVNTYKDLTNDLQFFHNFMDGKIYLCSKLGNPGERFQKIEFNVGRHIIYVTADNIVIDNLCLKYGGAHGIGADDTDGLTVQNCEIGWIGGSLQSGWQDTTRFGNGIEIWGSAKHFTVHNNYIYQVYDSAVSFQYRGEEISNMHFVNFTNNIIDKATSCIEYWSGGATGSDIKDFLIADNLLIRSGYGMGAQRPEQRGTINLTSGGFMNRLTGYFKIENNIIALSKIQLVNLSSGSGDLPEMNGNVFAHKRDKMFGQVLDKNQMVRFDENIEGFIKKSMADKNAKVVYITD